MNTITMTPQELDSLKAQWQAEALLDMIAVCSNEPWTAEEIQMRAVEIRRRAGQATHVETLVDEIEASRRANGENEA